MGFSSLKHFFSRLSSAFFLPYYLTEFSPSLILSSMCGKPAPAAAASPYETKAISVP